MFRQTSTNHFSSFVPQRTEVYRYGFDGEEIEITITNVLGEKVYTNIYPVKGNNYRLTLDFSNTLQTGTYFVTGRSSKNSISKKILIR